MGSLCRAEKLTTGMELQRLREALFFPYLPSVETVALEHGAYRFESTSTSNRYSRLKEKKSDRPPARIITVAWGDRYVSDLLSITLPALLAPGNIPAFAEHFACELVIVTESRLFAQILGTPVIMRFLDQCPVRLIPLDDLLSPWYGITLTYAYVRGFADLRKRMVDTHLVFLNADFIVADGSYRNLAEAILRGARLAFAPSYCVVLEDVIAEFKSRFDPTTSILCMPHREMAKAIMDHRHNTVRAKTVNQQLFRLHRHEQFYWYVDDQTMFARQMPIAVVYMRPEKVVTELQTFWDFGLVSELCPTARPHVFHDSDDFLMTELRAEGTLREHLHLGWPTREEIIRDLSSYATKDHIDTLEFNLCVHASDLTEKVAQEAVAFDSVITQIRKNLGPPISWLNHPYWNAGFSRFQTICAEQSARVQERESEMSRIRNASKYRELEKRARELRGALTANEQQQRQLADSLQSELQQVTKEVMDLIEESHSKKLSIETAVHQQRSLLQKQNEALKGEMDELLLEAMGPGVGEAISSQHLSVDPLMDVPPMHESEEKTLGQAEERNEDWLSVKGKLVACLIDAYKAIFGRLPNPKEAHPYCGVFKHLKALTEPFRSEQCDILLVSSGGPFGALLMSNFGGKKVKVTPLMVLQDLCVDIYPGERTFDLCVCDLTADDLLKLREIAAKLRPLVRDGGRIIAFHYNGGVQALDHRTSEFARYVFPSFGLSSIYFSGSRLGALVLKLYDRVAQSHDFSTVFGLLRIAVVLGLCAPFAWAAHRHEKRLNPRTLPVRCTSITLAIDL